MDPETDDPCRSVFRRNVRYSHLPCALTHIQFNIISNRACIISVLQLLTVVQSTQSKDSTYGKVGSALYGVIEPNLGIFCASIVTLKPLFNRCASQMSQRLGFTDNNSIQANGEMAPSWPVFRRPAMFTTSRRSRSRSRADKDFVMLSSDLTSSVASGKARSDKGETSDCIEPVDAGTRVDEESATTSRKRATDPC